MRSDLVWTVLVAMASCGCGGTPRAPGDVAGVADVTAIAIGTGQTCAVVAGGEVVCVGANARGELGRGSTSGTTLDPARVVRATGGALSGVTAIQAFDATTCARDGSGAYVCWGDDPLGVLETKGAASATEVPFLRGARTMTMATGEHLLAFHEPGTTVPPDDAIRFAYVCGAFDDAVRCRTARRSQVDRDTTIETIEVFGAPATHVASGTGALCVRSEGGEVLCDPFLARMTVSPSFSSTPRGCTTPPRGDGEPLLCDETRDETRSRVLDIGPELALVSVGSGASVDVGEQHACVRGDDGAVECLGLSTSGESGSASPADDRVARTRVSGIVGASAIAVGDAFACALANGEVRCWGNNTAGQLGPGETSITTEVPRRVDVGGAATAIAAGKQHACAAVGDARKLVCWGSASTTPTPAP